MNATAVQQPSTLETRDWSRWKADEKRYKMKSSRFDRCFSMRSSTFWNSKHRFLQVSHPKFGERRMRLVELPRSMGVSVTTTYSRCNSIVTSHTAPWVGVCPLGCCPRANRSQTQTKNEAKAQEAWKMSTPLSQCIGPPSRFNRWAKGYASASMKCLYAALCLVNLLDKPHAWLSEFIPSCDTERL